MSKFKKDDRVIITHPSREGQRGRITGVFSGGYGVHIDGTGRGTVFYYDVDMEHEPGNPPIHGGVPAGKEDDCRDLSHMMRASYPHGEPYSVGKKEDRPAEMKKFRTDDPLMQARQYVKELFYPGPALPIEDVYIVWFCSAVGNWKALVSTNCLDNAYYEVTWNGEKAEMYVDRYVKEYNVKIMHHESGELSDADVEWNRVTR